jgi:hypothetical protein
MAFIVLVTRNAQTYIIFNFAELTLRHSSSPVMGMPVGAEVSTETRPRLPFIPHHWHILKQKYAGSYVVDSSMINTSDCNTVL